MASEAKRTLGLAYIEYPRNASDWHDTEPLEVDLVCECVVGIHDPLRVEVPPAVLACQNAGITVRMVTGDNIATAKAIAKDCGILVDGGIAMEGPSFRKLPEGELKKILPRLAVLARSSPEDKLKLVQGLKSLGEVVAVTGDGTNDGPALKEADVGLSMGIAGTEVAKEASDVVIMDDNFSSIVASVKWGRSVYDNIRKFVQFQLTVNIVALAVAAVAAVSGERPLKPVQLLWVNLIMDTFAALALGTEPPTEDLLDRKPHGRSASLISRKMWRNIIGQSLYQLVVLFVILFAGHTMLGVEEHSVEHHTFLFNAFVFCQVFNEINCRKLYNEINVFSGMFDNFIFTGVIIFIILFQVFFVEVGGQFASTTGLSAGEWLACLFIGICCVPFGFFIRLIPVKEADDEEVTITGESESSGEGGAMYALGSSAASAEVQSMQRALNAKDVEVESLKGALQAMGQEVESLRRSVQLKEEELQGVKRMSSGYRG
eukprot:GFYU01011960.1.p1 GENE.GFYU01011960.1~~GFYU01011960.1.p1  ORF type:complete len:574 (-),score=220.77 GFYU01011960.1:562-2025(-)